MVPPAPHKPLDPRHSSSVVESCAFHLHSWRPFLPSPTPPPDPDPSSSSKRPCLSDRATSFPIDLSRLSLLDDSPYRPLGLLRKRRRRRGGGSRSVSGRSSDPNNRRCCSVGASAACSDFPAAIGTDSSGELFGNGDQNWASDVSEAAARKEEKECLVSGAAGAQFGNLDPQAVVADSGYGSEPGYRGDAEFGYGDEFDEEEEDPRPLFWGHRPAEDTEDTRMEMVGENTLLFTDQKTHYRCRRKKHDCRMVVDSLRL